MIDNGGSTKEAAPPFWSSSLHVPLRVLSEYLLPDERFIAANTEEGLEGSDAT